MVEKLKKSKYFHIIILLFLAVIWGSSFILIKKGLVSFSPTQVGSIRIVVAFLVMLPVAIKHLATVYKEKWKTILIWGFLANLIPAVLFATAQTGLSSSLTGILNSLTPIFILIVGAAFYSTAIKSKQIIGLVIGFIGSFALSFVGSNGEFGSFNFYVLFVIGATICYGIAGNMVKVYFNKINSIVLTSLAMFSVGPFGLVYLLTTDFTHVLFNVDGAWLSLFYLIILGAVGTAFALVIFYKIIQQTSAVFASTVTYLIPIMALVWGIIDGEALYPLHFVGMALIIFGVWIVNKAK